jgi:hypothetical protein
MQRARAYATVAPDSVGAYTPVGAYGSFKKLPSGVKIGDILVIFFFKNVFINHNNDRILTLRNFKSF